VLRIDDSYCFTIWVDGDGVNARSDAALTRRTLDAWRVADADTDVGDGTMPRQAALSVDGARAAAALARSPLARSVSRACYAEAYESSLRRSLAASEDARGRAVAVATHRAHVRAARAAPELCELVDALRGACAWLGNTDEAGDVGDAEHCAGRGGTTARNAPPQSSIISIG
jgi:hypothetical protein